MEGRNLDLRQQITDLYHKIGGLHKEILAISGTSGLSIPTVSGQTGKYLTNNGTIVSWGSIAAAGANAALSNLASVAINLALVPGADGTLAIGNATNRWTNLFISDTGSINWANGSAVISHNAGAELVAAASNGTFRVFKSGQVGTFQVINGSFTDGIQIASDSLSIRSLAGTSTITIANGATEKLAVGVMASVANGKLHITASTAGLAALAFDLGVAPTSPIDLTMWWESNTNTGLKARVNGVTKTVTLS